LITYRFYQLSIDFIDYVSIVSNKFWSYGLGTYRLSILSIIYLSILSIMYRLSTDYRSIVPNKCWCQISLWGI